MEKIVVNILGGKFKSRPMFSSIDMNLRTLWYIMDKDDPSTN